MQMGNPFDSRGTNVMIIGILSFVICQLLGPVAWIMGRNLKRDAEMANYPEPGTGKAGRILGMVGTILMVVAIVFFVVIFIAGASSSTSY